MADEPVKKKRVLCKVCQQVTWHSVLNKAESGNSYDEDSGIWDSSEFFTLQCLGCDNVCLLIEYSCSENYNPGNGEIDVDSTVHPTPTKEERELIDKYYIVPDQVQIIYKETIKAFNAGLYLLAAIGVRTAIEAISRDQGITVRGIESKIKKMVEKNIITQAGADLLLIVKNMGNLSAHEIKKHHHDDLSLCIDVVETVLKNLYILPKSVRTMHGQ